MIHKFIFMYYNSVSLYLLGSVHSMLHKNHIGLFLFLLILGLSTIEMQACESHKPKETYTDRQISHTLQEQPNCTRPCGEIPLNSNCCSATGMSCCCVYLPFHEPPMSCDRLNKSSFFSKKHLFIYKESPIASGFLSIWTPPKINK